MHLSSLQLNSNLESSVQLVLNIETDVDMKASSSILTDNVVVVVKLVCGLFQQPAFVLSLLFHWLL